KKLSDCAGHFGYIQLELPVFHAGYFRHTLVVLQCVCKRCARVMLASEERAGFLRKLQAPYVDALMRGGIFKRIVELCKRTSRCPYCGYCNDTHTHMTGTCFKIVHEKFRAKVPQNEEGESLIQAKHMAEIARAHPELKPTMQKAVELLTPLRSWDILKRISDEDLTLLWMQSQYGRASTADMGGGSTEDDLTVKLQEIIEMNNALKMALEKGATMKMVTEDWEFLQIQMVTEDWEFLQIQVQYRT
ncbi:hypothetical protein B484DRAFT_390049, partial [Ochromonadaceae sp. CCMP2298]